MNKNHRKILAELQDICNQLGAPLDMTATSTEKLHDRAMANMLVSNVLYGILCDEPQNEQRSFDMESALNSLESLRCLCKKKYKNKNSY